jgi:serine/threonine protein kinase
MAVPQPQQKPRIGKYEILGTLGRGSMGVVYKARDPEIDRIVALKTLRTFSAEADQDPDAALERFKSEARSAGSLRHPNIITVFEINRDGDTPYLVMDYVEGESLEAIIAHHTRLDPMVVLFYLLQLAAGLDFAHARGVIHRDVKPGNVHIDRHGRVFILDFGVAFFRDELAQGTASGAVIGTPGYMSPEQILSESLDAKTDLFSLAAVAFECLTGKRPFAGETFTDVISNILAGNLLSLTELRPDLPLALEAEFEKALSRERFNRFGSATELAEAFCEAVGVDPSTVRNSPSAANLPSMPRKKKSSGWKSLRPDVIPEVKVTAPVREEVAVGAAQVDPVLSNPWDFENRRGSPEKPLQRVAPRSNPGDMFTQFEGLQRITAINQAQTERQSRSLKRLTLVFAGVCIALGSGLLYLVMGASPSAAPVTPTTEVRVGVTSSETSPPVVSVEEGVVLGAPAVEAPPPGAVPAALTDRQLVGLLVDETASETLLVDAIREAKLRSVVGLAEASVVPLKNRSYVVRVEMIKTLAELGDKRVVPDLMLRLDDQDALVRGHAARALGILGDRRALGYLTMRFQKEDSSQAKSAMKKAIERIQGFPFAE